MKASVDREAPNRVAEIRERAEAATPGPWAAVSDNFKSAIKFGREFREKIVESENHAYPEGFGQKRGGVVHSWDAEFIAHAREDIPWLLERIESLARENAELHEWKLDSLIEHDRDRFAIAAQAEQIARLSAELTEAEWQQIQARRTDSWGAVIPHTTRSAIDAIITARAQKPTTEEAK